ncbi:hypothetical protein KXX31_008972, partial [Aspergillus fumigatus]
PTGRRALACAPPPPPPPRPPRPPRPPFVALARATLCSPRGRAPTGPPAPLNRLPSTGTLARAAGGPSPTHTHRPRPAHHRARKRSRVRTRGSPRPSRPANWRESMEVEIPRGPAVTGAPPRRRRKVSGPPSQRPARPGPGRGGGWPPSEPRRGRALRASSLRAAERQPDPWLDLFANTSQQRARQRRALGGGPRHLSPETRGGTGDGR